MNNKTMHYRRMKPYQDTRTGSIIWNTELPSEFYVEVPMVYEDELPANMTDDEYKEWFSHSVVEMVRVGIDPKILKGVK